MSAPARVPDDATYVDEEARWSLFLSILDRIATALEAQAPDPVATISTGYGETDDLPPWQPAPLPGTVAPSFPVGPVAAAAPVSVAPSASWACPEHHQVVIQGNSPVGSDSINKAGGHYLSFLKCPVRNCNQRPPR